MADDAPGGSKRRVDMIRVERPQQVFDRDEVLGRDTSSVFPSETRRQAEQAGMDVADAMRAAIGGVRFITEKDVQEIKAKRGTSAEDEAAAVSSKPLAQILSEKREAKNEEFQEQWKIMKQGERIASRSARAPHDSLSIADSSLYAYARNQVRTSRSRKMSWRF